MKKGRLLKVTGVLVLVAAATVSVLAFTYRSNRTTRALPVETHRVAVEALVETVSGTGTFVPEISSMVYARVSGVAEKILAASGDRVTEGSPLLELDLSDFTRAVRQAESSLSSAKRSILQSIGSLRAAWRNAQTAADQARRNLEKNLELFKIQAVSEEVLDQTKDALESATVNLRSAREQLNLRLGLSPDADPAAAGLSDDAIAGRSPEVLQAEIALETARSNLSRARITSPVAGTVTQFIPSRGDFISPNAPVAKVESLDRMRADVQIDEVDIGKLSPGAVAEITSDSLLGTTLTGTVTSIAPVISQVGSTRVSLVKIALDAGGRELKAGASCTARITTRTRDSVLAIPLTGFVTRDNVSHVYVLKPEEEEGAETPETPDIPAGTPDREKPALYLVEERAVDTGVSTITRIEVVSGLSEGELIAVGDLDVLRDGMRVTPRLDSDAED